MDNQLQKDMWNGRAGASWVRHNSLLEELLSEPGRQCMALFDLPASAQVLDVGCGCGNQTLDWAARLDPSSTITGVDISEPMLALAEDLKSANHSSLQANVSFVMGDASEPLFPEASFDAIYSRFGVMFFADPTAAFAQLRSNLKPDGQLQSPAGSAHRFTTPTAGKARSAFPLAYPTGNVNFRDVSVQPLRLSAPMTGFVRNRERGDLVR